MGEASTPEAIAAQLYKAATDRAALHDRRIGDGADQDIRALANGAARELAEHAERMPEAIAAFETLVDAMVDAAAEIPGYQASRPDVIGEQTLARALSRLCPLHPIC